MYRSRTISITINRDWKDVYEAYWRPEDFPKWASGLSSSILTHDGNSWNAEGPEGFVSIRFTGHNDFGVMDHSDQSEAFTPFCDIEKIRPCLREEINS